MREEHSEQQAAPPFHALEAGRTRDGRVRGCCAAAHQPLPGAGVQQARQCPKPQPILFQPLSRPEGQGRGILKL